MGIFKDLKSDGLEQSQDRLGGFQLFDTDAYESSIKLAYAITSDGGAQGVVFNFDLNDKEYRETIYITNKQGENFFLNKDDPTKKVPLPGYTTVNDICLMTTDKPLSEQDTEAKMVNVWDNDAKKEVPKSVPVLTELLGQKVTLGILKQLVNKNEKNQSSGKYEPTAETREENVIEKVFHSPTHMTVVEAQNGATEAKFYDAWVAKNRGQLRDKRKIKDGSAGTSGRPNSGPPASGSAAPKTSLFNKS
jgi:hypothetical protein